MLPNIPNEIFDIWLSDLIMEYGWPFESTFDTLTGGWVEHLADLTLEILANFTWDKKSFTLNTLTLKPLNLIVIKRMISQSINSLQAATEGPIFNSKNRLFFHANNITKDR